MSDIIHDLQRDYGDAAADTAMDIASDMRTHGDDHGAAVWRAIADELARERDRRAAA